MQDGRGEERISYFGNGFRDRECGISIANADDNDKSPWKCFIGVDDDKDLKTMGAIIDGSDRQQTTQGSSHYFAINIFLLFSFALFFSLSLFRCPFQAEENEHKPKMHSIRYARKNK